MAERPQSWGHLYPFSYLHFALKCSEKHLSLAPICAKELQLRGLQLAL